MVLSSSMSARLFEGDLNEGKGLEPCSQRWGELVAIQSLASHRDESHPSLLNEAFRSQK